MCGCIIHDAEGKHCILAICVLCIRLLIYEVEPAEAIQSKGIIDLG